MTEQEIDQAFDNYLNSNSNKYNKRNINHLPMIELGNPPTFESACNDYISLFDLADNDKLAIDTLKYCKAVEFFPCNCLAHNYVDKEAVEKFIENINTNCEVVYAKSATVKCEHGIEGILILFSVKPMIIKSSIITSGNLSNPVT